MKIKVEIEGQSFEVSIQDLHARPVVAEVNGQSYEVYPEEQTAPAQSSASAPAPKTSIPVSPAPVIARPAAAVASGGPAMRAPLPGTIVAIEVREGDKVKAGQELLTLEAMKMKNAIRSDRDGEIAKINVAVGDLVKHNEPLVTFKA